MTTPANLNALKLTGANPLITGHVYINPTSENLTIASASENITLDSQNVSFWTDAGKTTALTFNGLVGNLATEVTDRTTAVAAAQVAAEATAQTALDATTVTITAELADFVSANSTALTDLDTSLRSTIATINGKLGSDIAVGDALNASNLTAFETATASNFTDESNARTAADDALDARVANIEALIAAINSAP